MGAARAVVGAQETRTRVPWGIGSGLGRRGLPGLGLGWESDSTGGRVGLGGGSGRTRTRVRLGLGLGSGGGSGLARDFRGFG